jgi:hypothetical protein
MKKFLGEINRFLLFLADIPMPQIPQRFLRHLDRYVRTGKHRVTGDGTRVQATVLVVRERQRRLHVGLAY